MQEPPRSDNPFFTLISRKILLTLITQVLLGFIGLTSWYFVANFLPRAYVGVVGFAMGFCGLTSFLTDFGFSAAHTKKISEGKDMSQCIGTYVVIRVILLIIFLLSVLSVIFFWKIILGRGFESQAHEYVIYLMLVYYVCLTMASIGTNTYTAKVQTARTQIIILLAASVQLVTTIFVVVFTNNVYLYACTFIVNSGINLLVSIFFLSKFPISKPSKSLALEYLKFAMPIMVISTLATLPINIDKVMIQLFRDSDQVGLYIGGQKFSLYLIQFATGIGIILFPLFSSFDSKNKTGQAKDLIFFSERLIAMMMAPAVAIVFILALPLVTILGDIQYKESYLVLQPLAIWAFITTLNMPYSNYIKGSGKMKVLIFISSISLILIVFFNFIFIPPDIKFLGLNMLGLGPAGAAYATLIATCVTFVMFRFFTFRKIGIIFNVDVIRAIAAGVLTAEFLFVIQYLFPATRIFLLVLYAVVGGLLYLVILMVSGGVKNEDISLFENVIDPTKMIGYIKKELMLRDKDQEESGDEK